MNTGFDPDLLASELESIFTINMADFGFLDDVTDVDLPEDDYEVPDADERVVRAQYGDVYRLGNHRLMCGNSADPDDVRKLMNGTLADLFLTDPPYNVAIGSKNLMLSKMRSENNTIKQDIHGDDKSKTDDEMARDLWRPAFLNAIANAWDHCACYVFSPQGDAGYVMAKALMSAGWNAKHLLVWVKNEATFSMGRLDYDYQHEPIMYTWTKSHHN
jgi:DNA modification methylase